jgi:hypothetical protein
VARQSSLHDEQPSYRAIWILGRLEVIGELEAERWGKVLGKLQPAEKNPTAHQSTIVDAPRRRSYRHVLKSKTLAQPADFAIKAISDEYGPDRFSKRIILR